MKKDAQRIARSSSTVLLVGESGVGKDIFARTIHAASPRTKHSFVKVNCAAIPETLLESELFGYAPGSFTRASKKGKSGYFERAAEGQFSWMKLEICHSQFK
ncbi:MAG: sigma 54-interacting transcriptional regulator [Desulfitobacteriaceae bacterium]|nr:sigma 54-interacting transcriptional regulator [Desulfitobacteriaceae bacterium]